MSSVQSDVETGLNKVELLQAQLDATETHMEDLRRTYTIVTMVNLAWNMMLMSMIVFSNFVD